jgi:RNA polymerase sigma factor (sigma-70 family)
MEGEATHLSLVGRAFDGLDDARLIPLVRAGDAAAYRYLCEVALPLLFQFAYHIIRSRETAEDAVQTVLADVWIYRTRFHPAGPLRAYLYRCVRNQLLDTIDHARVVERAEEIVDAEEPYGMGTKPEPADALSETADTITTVSAAIQQLPERQRTAVLLRWYDGMTTAEVAQVMGIARQVAERLLQKGEAKLRIALHNLRTE